ncbi:MAG: nitroreductase [Ruminococcaceae bacterium]|nr:nitroreductase [Oscillospiraceae bacterium]
MELRDVLKKRASYRFDFTDRKVTKDELKYIVEAAFLAPSASNRQTPRIIGVLDDEKVLKLGEIYGFDWAKTATAAVVIAYKEIKRPGKRSRHLEDFGAAAQNLLLAVTDLGFATTWIQGQIEDGKSEQMAKLLNLPEDIFVIGYFPIGEPSREFSGPDKMSFDERCFLNEFGSCF